MSTIQIKRRVTSGAPSSLAFAEPAWGDADGKLYMGTNAGAVVAIAGIGVIFNPMSVLGDLLYGGSSGAASRLVGNTSATREFLRSVGSSGSATSPVWDTLQDGDIPSTLARLASPALSGTPTTPTATAGTGGTQVASCGYADAAVSAAVNGLNWKVEADARTTAALPSYTYSNGTSGVGATLTAIANGALAAQDGFTLSAGQVLAVMNETSGNAAYNGLYTVTQLGDSSHPWILTRHADMDTGAEVLNATFIVLNGTAYAGWEFTVSGVGPYTMGTTAIAFTTVSMGTFTAGTGLTLTGNQFALSTPVSVANGGTGVSSLSGLRSAISAAASGANADITSMTGLTGALKAPTGIQDASGNWIENYSTAGASAVNYLTVGNATTGNAVAVGATGSDTNVNLNLTTKGTGVVQINGNTALTSASTIDGGTY